MSDTSQGPGWWQASDGKWYRPELHPNYAPRPQAPNPNAGAPSTRSRSRGPLIAVATMVVLLLAVGVGVGLYVADKASAIGLGSGTATITWTSVAGSGIPDSGSATNSPPQPFTGSIEGIAVSGTASFVGPPHTNGLPPSGETVPFQRYAGSFDGKPFNLEVTITLSQSASLFADGGIAVNGTWGSESVHAVVTLPANPNGTTAGFHGTVGQWKLTGTIDQPARSGNTTTETASFNVSQ